MDIVSKLRSNQTNLSNSMNNIVDKFNTSESINSCKNTVGSYKDSLINY